MLNLTFLNKKNLLRFLLVLWIVFSVGYIGWNIWNNVKNILMNQAYGQGVSDTVNQLIQQTENNDCQPIHIFNKDKNKDVQLINTTCVTKPK